MPPELLAFCGTITFETAEAHLLSFISTSKCAAVEATSAGRVCSILSAIVDCPIAPSVKGTVFGLLSLLCFPPMAILGVVSVGS